MRVNAAFDFPEPQLRSIRAALGRGGVATRKDCRVFILRAVEAALKAAPTPKAARRKALPESEPHTVGTDAPTPENDPAGRFRVDKSLEYEHRMGYHRDKPHAGCAECALPDEVKAKSARSRIAGCYKTKASWDHE